MCAGALSCSAQAPTARFSVLLRETDRDLVELRIRNTGNVQDKVVVLYPWELE